MKTSMHILSLQTAPATSISGLRMENGVPVRRFRKDLIKTGTFVKQSEDLNFTVDEKTLDHWALTFSQWVAGGNKVPIPMTHSAAGNPKDNAGWVIDMYKEGDRLIGVLELIGEEANQLALASDVSIYVPASYTDGSGKKYNRPITHVALCTDPVIPGLGKFEAIAASLSSIQVKEQKMKKVAESLGLKTEGMQDSEVETLVLSSIAALQSEKKTLETEKKAVEDKVTTLQLSAKPKDVDPQLVELTIENRNGKLEQLVQAARITPAVAKDLQAVFANPQFLTLSLSRGQKDNFSELIAALGKNDPVVLGELSGKQVVMLQNRAAGAVSPLVVDAEARAKKAT